MQSQIRGRRQLYKAIFGLKLGIAKRFICETVHIVNREQGNEMVTSQFIRPITLESS